MRQRVSLVVLRLLVSSKVRVVIKNGEVLTIAEIMNAPRAAPTAAAGR